MIDDSETLDDLRLGGLKIIQKRCGYRFSIDPVLLCAFAEIGEGGEVADLGTGCGVIPLLLAKTTDARRIVGVELQQEMAERARRSVALNGLDDRVEILTGDLRRHRDLFKPQSFQVVLANPPYRRAGSGRHAPQSERAQARHELAGGLNDFLTTAAYLLGDGGRFFIVYLPERTTDLLAGMRRTRLEPKRLRCVHGRFGDPARMVLVEARKGGAPGLEIEPPLFVYDGDEYSEELLNIYGGRGL